MNTFSEAQPTAPTPGQGSVPESACAVALVLMARKTACSFGLDIPYQDCDETTLMILMRGPYTVLKKGPAKDSFTELLSLSHTAAFFPRKNTLEILLRFNLIECAKEFSGQIPSNPPQAVP